VGVTHSSPDYAVIHDGIEAGDRIITSTIRNPLSGMAVEVGSRPERRVVAVKDEGDGPG
jgi:hypothetical protein